jgi:hypothetical protein
MLSGCSVLPEAQAARPPVTSSRRLNHWPGERGRGRRRSDSEYGARLGMAEAESDEHASPAAEPHGRRPARRPPGHSESPDSSGRRWCSGRRGRSRAGGLQPWPRRQAPTPPRCRLGVPPRRRRSTAGHPRSQHAPSRRRDAIPGRLRPTTRPPWPQRLGRPAERRWPADRRSPPATAAPRPILPPGRLGRQQSRLARCHRASAAPMRRCCSYGREGRRLQPAGRPSSPD